jgi:hypothetical protein
VPAGSAKLKVNLLIDKKVMNAVQSICSIEQIAGQFDAPATASHCAAQREVDLLKIDAHALYILCDISGFNARCARILCTNV